MALEDALKANTHALEAMTAALKRQTALLEGGMAKATATAREPAKRPRGRPRKSANPSAEDLYKKFDGYLSSVDEKADRRRLIATVKPILKYFRVDRVPDIVEKHREEAMAYADLLIAGFREGGVDGAEEVELPCANTVLE